MNTPITDNERLDFMERNASRVYHLGTTWYSRSGYGTPVLAAKTLRDAIDRQIIRDRTLKSKPR